MPSLFEIVRTEKEVRSVLPIPIALWGFYLALVIFGRIPGKNGDMTLLGNGPDILKYALLATVFFGAYASYRVIVVRSILKYPLPVLALVTSVSNSGKSSHKAEFTYAANGREYQVDYSFSYGESVAQWLYPGGTVKLIVAKNIPQWWIFYDRFFS